MIVHCVHPSVDVYGGRIAMESLHLKRWDAEHKWTWVMKRFYCRVCSALGAKSESMSLLPFRASCTEFAHGWKHSKRHIYQEAKEAIYRKYVLLYEFFVTCCQWFSIVNVRDPLPLEHLTWTLTCFIATRHDAGRESVGAAPWARPQVPQVSQVAQRSQKRGHMSWPCACATGATGACALGSRQGLRHRARRAPNAGRVICRAADVMLVVGEGSCPWGEGGTKMMTDALALLNLRRGTRVSSNWHSNCSRQFQV